MSSSVGSRRGSSGGGGRAVFGSVASGSGSAGAPSTDPFASAALSASGTNLAWVRAHPCSQLLFLWLGPVFALGAGLTQEDLPSLERRDTATAQADVLGKAWEAEVGAAAWAREHRGELRRPSLIRAMLDAYAWEYLPKSAILVLKSLFAVAQAVTLGFFLETLSDSSSEFAIADGWVLATLVVVFGAGLAGCHHWAFFHGWRFGMRWRAALTALLHAKQLRLTMAAAHSGAGAGKVTTLVATDTERLQKSSQFLFFLVVGPIELAVTFTALYLTAGVASVTGMVLLVAMVPLQVWFSRLFATLRRRAAEFTDERVKLTSQAVDGMQVVKAGTWEPSILQAVSQERRRELAAIRTTNSIRAVNEGIFIAAPIVIAGVVFLTRVALGEPLTPRIVFSTLGLVNSVSLMATKFLPFTVESVSETVASLKRMEEFLLLPEIQPGAKKTTRRAGQALLQYKTRLRSSSSSSSLRAASSTPSMSPHAPDRLRSESEEDVVVIDEALDNILESAPHDLNSTVLLLDNLHARWNATVSFDPKAALATIQEEEESDEEEEEVEGRGVGVTSDSSATTDAPADAPATTTDVSTTTEPTTDTTSAVSVVGASPSTPAALITHASQPLPPPPVSSAGSADAFGLRGISLEVRQGSLHCVAGSVGAGKSSLLQAVLGEMEQTEGMVKLKDLHEVRERGIAARAGKGVVEREKSGRGRRRGRDTAVPMYSRVAYAPQQPWIITGSFRENIVLGRPWDPERYEQVIKACSLERDVTLLHHGHDTKLGEHGANLSGGQRARLSLARCVYGDASLYLLDDPLSAVDAKVAKNIFENCIEALLLNRKLPGAADQGGKEEDEGDEDGRGGGDGGDGGGDGGDDDGDDDDDSSLGLSPKEEDEEMKRRERMPAVMLVTHQVQWAPRCDHVSVMRDGAIIASGPPGSVDLSHVKAMDEEEASESVVSGDGSHFRERIVSTGGLSVSSLDHGEEAFMGSTTTEQGSGEGAGAGGDDACVVAGGEEGEDGEGGEMGQEERAAKAEEEGVIVEEGRESGNVSWQTLLAFFGAAGGVWVLVALTILYLVGMGFLFFTQMWLAAWSQVSEEEQRSGFWLGTYSSFIALTLALSLLRSISFFNACIVASQNLHDATFARVLTAPLAFFWANPAGRILSRFSKDLGYVDDMLPWAANDFLALALYLLGSCVVASVAIPWLVMAVVPMCVGLYLIRQYYLRTALAVRRIEAVLRSPIFHMINETHAGLAAARALGLRGAMQKLLLSALDWNNRAFFLFLATSRWFGLRLDLAGLAVLAVTAWAAVLLKDTVDPGVLGLALTSLSALLGTSQWMMRQSAEVQVYAVSIERLLEYAKIPNEDVQISHHTKHTTSRTAAGTTPSQAPSTLLPLTSPLHTSTTTSTRTPSTTTALVPTPTPLQSPPQPAALVPPDWPKSGHLRLNHVSLRYRPGAPLVLRDVTATIPSGSRVGVVGRTGAGKSSLLLALLRLVEYENGQEPASGERGAGEGGGGGGEGGEGVSASSASSSASASSSSTTTSSSLSSSSSSSSSASASAVGVVGKRFSFDGEDWGIFLDGVRTTEVGLSRLRRELALIGQNPILFAGTLRSNLDPFGDFLDEELLRALEAVQLTGWVASLRGGLDAVVSGGGSNLSVGQRQLLALARIILRPSHVLLLDEPSANIDQRTDAALQAALRREFADATVITVAHRLATVADSDQLLVLDAGRLVECGSPAQLLANPRSIFAGLVRETGDTELPKLIAAAEKEKKKKKSMKKQT